MRPIGEWMAKINYSKYDVDEWIQRRWVNQRLGKYLQENAKSSNRLFPWGGHTHA